MNKPLLPAVSSSLLYMRSNTTGKKASAQTYTMRAEEEAKEGTKVKGARSIRNGMYICISWVRTMTLNLKSWQVTKSGSPTNTVVT